MVDERAEEAQNPVLSGTGAKNCEQCGLEISTEGRKRISYRRFCSDRCRNAYHKAEREKLQLEARQAVEQLGSIFDRVFKKGRR